MVEEPVQEVTEEEREAARRRVCDLVLDEIKRVVVAISVENELGFKPELSIKLNRYGGPELIIDHDTLSGLQLAKLGEMAGQNLEVELYDGKIVVFSPSWSPDRIPF